MRKRLRPDALVLLSSLVLIGCSGGEAGSVRSVSSVGPTDIGEPVQLSATPATVVPQFVTAPGCTAQPPFRARVSVSVRAERPVLVRGIGFELVDGFGGRSVPQITPGSTTAASIPTTMPIPLPSSPPVPTPASQPVPLPGQPASGGARVAGGNTTALPFVLLFECGAPSSGTLLIAVEALDENGAPNVTRTSVRVSR